jgi:predicted NBD/HSP70 family sugar kinase
MTDQTALPVSDAFDDRSTHEPVDVALRGSNQSGMRAHNERLVLSLVRQQGALAKSDIARITGLSAQTVSVIMRSLESDGLLVRGEPIRGRIGQPSVPMSLAADGAFFLGLKIGRRSADLMLVDFVGTVRGMHRRTYGYPTPSTIIAFVTEALPGLTRNLPDAVRDRISGMGVAMPFQLWNWVQAVGAPQEEMDEWRNRDIQAELATATGLPVYVQNDATSACGAELVFGSGERPRDFLYFYFGYFIGGGLVLNGQLFLGRSGNAAGVGPLPMPGAGGASPRLFDLASMSALARAMDAAGEDSSQLWENPDQWQVSEPLLQDWIDRAAQGLALATLSAASLLELEAVMIDGWMPPVIRARITEATRVALAKLDLSGITPLTVREGTVGPMARSLGAAAIPLSQRYLIDQNAAARTA